jgi:hypothetical protein
VDEAEFGRRKEGVVGGGVLISESLNCFDRYIRFSFVEPLD